MIARIYAEVEQHGRTYRKEILVDTNNRAQSYANLEALFNAICTHEKQQPRECRKPVVVVPMRQGLKQKKLEKARRRAVGG